MDVGVFSYEDEAESEAKGVVSFVEAKGARLQQGAAEVD